MMMPQAAAFARSTAPSDLISHLPTFPPTRDSSLTATSKLATDDADAASDGGSIGSSVSLISVPSSDDEDAEDWQDSRSHVVTSPPEIQTMRDAGEYVVLFDDTSSDEE
jgi:next to BRCA1 gene 1 protein